MYFFHYSEKGFIREPFFIRKLKVYVIPQRDEVQKRMTLHIFIKISFATCRFTKITVIFWTVKNIRQIIYVYKKMFLQK